MLVIIIKPYIAISSVLLFQRRAGVYTAFVTELQAACLAGKPRCDNTGPEQFSTHLTHLRQVFNESVDRCCTCIILYYCFDL